MRFFSIISKNNISKHKKKDCFATILSSHFPDSNWGPTHYECVALPLSQSGGRVQHFHQKRLQRYNKKITFANYFTFFFYLLHFWNNFCISTMQNEHSYA